MAKILSYGSLANKASIAQRIPEQVYESLEEEDLEALGIRSDMEGGYGQAVEKVRLYREMRRELEENRPAGFTDKEIDEASEILKDNLPGLDVDEEFYRESAEEIWSEERPELEPSRIPDEILEKRRPVGAYAAEKWMEENSVEIEGVRAGLTPIYCLDASSGSMLGATPSENRSPAVLISGLTEKQKNKIEADERNASGEGGYYNLEDIPYYREASDRPDGSAPAFVINKESPLVTREAGLPNPEYRNTVEEGFNENGLDHEALVVPVPGPSEELGLREAFNTLEENRKASEAFNRLMNESSESFNN